MCVYAIRQTSRWQHQISLCSSLHYVDRSSCLQHSVTATQSFIYSLSVVTFHLLSEFAAVFTADNSRPVTACHSLSLTVDWQPSQLAEHTFQSVTMNLNFIVRLLSSIPVVAFMVYLLHWGCTKSNWVETGCYSAWLHNFGKCSIGGNSFTLGRIQQ